MREITGKTRFFRYLDLFIPIEMIIPSLQQPRIASVGCSTGEEAYSFVLWNWMHNLSVDGYDVDKRRISVAKAGRYTIYERSDKQFFLPENVKRNSYHLTPENVPSWYSVTFNDEAKSRLNFSVLDIINAPLPKTYEAIVLSNVLQHMDIEEKESTLEHISASLEGNGWLICEPCNKSASDSPYLQERVRQYNEWRGNLEQYGFKRERPRRPASKRAMIYRKR